MIVSYTLSQAQLFLREIKGRIKKDVNYRQYAGSLVPKNPEKWTSQEIIINRSNLDLKDATISTVGTGGTILARRADIIICDDILNPDIVKTDEKRREFKKWFAEVLLPVLEPKTGRLIMVGTIWHVEDLLNKAMDSPFYEYRKKYQAVINESEHKELWEEWFNLLMASQQDGEKFLANHKEEMYKGVEVLWADRFPYDVLYLLRKENPIAFEKSYQNNIIDDETRKFKEEWLDKAKELGKSYRLLKELPPDMNLECVTQGVDLAISEKATADDTAIVSLGKMPDNMLMVLNIERGKFSPATTRKNIIEQWKNFRSIQIRVESVAYQESMRRDMADMNLPVKGYRTGGEKFKEDIGVDTVATLIENKRLILPYDNSDPRTINLIDQLVDEMREFPTGHTGDSLMALWFAYTAMRDVFGGSNFLQFLRIKEEEQKAEQKVEGYSLGDFMSMYKKQGGH